MSPNIKKDGGWGLSGWSHKWLSLLPKQILYLTLTKHPRFFLNPKMFCYCLNITTYARCFVLKPNKSISLCWEVFWRQGATPKGTFSIQIRWDTPEPGCYSAKSQALSRTAAISPSRCLCWNLRDEVTSLYLRWIMAAVK